METEQKSFLERINANWITPLLAIITAVYGFMFKMNSDKLNNLQTQIETQLRQKEFENNLKLTIYQEVKEAIVKKDTTLQNATLIVVNEMLKDDSIFREKLKTVLFASTNSNSLINVQNKIDNFTVEQASTTTLTAPDTFKIDVFYLDAIPVEAKSRAEKVVALLKSIYPRYTIRLRLLPKEINARSGYRIDSNQIRYEESELQIAKTVLDAINKNKIFEQDKPKLNLTTYYTPYYCSIFVRNK